MTYLAYLHMYSTPPDRRTKLQTKQLATMLLGMLIPIQFITIALQQQFLCKNIRIERF